MSSPKLLAVDLDGTLLARDGVPHEADVKALRAAREAGVIVTILTGRLIAGTRGAARALGLDGPLGCADGAHIVHAGSNQTLFHRTIAGPAALSLQRQFARAGASTFLFLSDTVVHDDAGAVHLPYVSGWSEQLEQVTSVYEHPAWQREASGVTAVVSVGTESQIRGIADSIRAELPEHAQVLSFQMRDGPWGLIARSIGVSKGTALRFIAEHSNVAMADTVAVGDWLNDLAMFEVAGRSYAMAQAPDEVKRAVTSVLPESFITGGGIARVVREVFGIR